MVDMTGGVERVTQLGAGINYIISFICLPGPQGLWPPFNVRLRFDDTCMHSQLTLSLLLSAPPPPSNLLDKIACGIAHAKGPLDWPHSVRAMRVKHLELAKKRAEDESLPHSDVSDIIALFHLSELCLWLRGESPPLSPSYKTNTHIALDGPADFYPDIRDSGHYPSST